MNIGVPKEIKNNENRVAVTPAGVEALVHAGHSVKIQTKAGVGSGFTDESYEKAGAVIRGVGLGGTGERTGVVAVGVRPGILHVSGCACRDGSTGLFDVPELIRLERHVGLRSGNRGVSIVGLAGQGQIEDLGRVNIIGRGAVVCRVLIGSHRVGLRVGTVVVLVAFQGG